MQIERAAKNSKPRNGFEFSYNPPAAATPQQPPQSQAASPPTTTQSIGGFVEVLGASYCSSCRGKLCGVTSSCSQCRRDVHEHCFVTLRGEGHRWCFACACRGCAKPLGNTDTQQCRQCKCYVHVECALDGLCLQCPPRTCLPCPPPTKIRTFHTSWQSGRPWLKYENGVMWCAACRAHPQLGAQPEWIGGITGIRWHKIARHQKGGTHAVSLALWSSGGRVRRVTHTLPMEQRHALRAQFHLIYHVVKRLGMLRGVAGDAEAATLNVVHLIEAYRCHRAVAEILQHVAMHVRIGEAQPVTQALPKDWRRGWKRSSRPWSYGCGASNNDASHQSAANGAAFYFFVVQLVLTCLQPANLLSCYACNSCLPPVYVSTHPATHCKLTTYSKTNVCTPTPAATTPFPYSECTKIFALCF